MSIGRWKGGKNFRVGIFLCKTFLGRVRGNKQLVLGLMRIDPSGAVYAIGIDSFDVVYVIGIDPRGAVYVTGIHPSEKRIIFL